MTTTYDVVSEGRILPGTERAQVLSHMQAAFNIDLRTAEKFVLGRSRVIKRGLDEAAARKYISKLTSIGLACRIDKPDADPPEKPEALSITPQPAAPCPKCGFQIDDKHCPDCPNCGIVISKYLDLNSRNDATPASAHSSATAKGNLIVAADTQPVSLLLRASTGIASIVVASLFVNLFRLFIAMYLYGKFSKQLSTPTVGGIWHVSPETASLIRTCETVVGLFAIMALLIYFVVRPAMCGGTWAQRFSDIRIVFNDPHKHPGVGTWLLRLAGNMTSLVCIALTILAIGFPLQVFLFQFLKKIIIFQQHTGVSPNLIVAAQMVATIFGYYLLFRFLRWLNRKKWPSLADKFSGTRQVRQETVSSRGLVSIWIVIIIAAGLSAGTGLIARSLLSPPDKAGGEEQRIEYRLKANMKAIEKTRLFEDRFYRENGHYTDDVHFFLQMYCERRSLRDKAIVDAIADGRLSVELTESGYTATLRGYGNPPHFYIMTEAGYQGIRDETGAPVEE